MTATLLKNRAVIRLSPQDENENVTEFLQGLVTNDVSGELPVYAALLTPQGKTLFDFIIWGDGNDLLVDCEGELTDELVKRLSLYRLRRKITIACDKTLAVHWSLDDSKGQPDPRLSALGHRWIANAAGTDDNAEPGDDAWLAHRLSLGVPETRNELGDILWLETNAAELNGVSFEKGCYIGQENTARMNWRSKVNRRLVVVPLDQSDEKRRKAAYPDMNLAIDHVRVADLTQANLPDWQAAAINVAD